MSKYSTQEEIWKDVVGYENYYEVSNKGNVRSVDRVVEGRHGADKAVRGQKMSQEIMHDGYKRVQLSKKGKRKKFPVHRLVAGSFIPNPDNHPVINHKDEVKDNNRVENLEWCTQSYNVKYGNGIKKMMDTKGWKETRNNQKVKRTDLSSGETVIYNSLREAHRDGFVRSSISRCIKRGDAVYKNNKWKYV